MVTKNGGQNRLNIEKWPFWTKFKALGDRFLRIRYPHSKIPKHPLNMLCAVIILISVKMFLVFAYALC